MQKSILKYLLVFIALFFCGVSLSQSKKILRQGLRLSDPKAQIEEFNKAIASDNKNYDAYFYRGIAKSNLDDHFGAILDFTLVIGAKPNADAYYNRGNSKFILNDFKGAYYDYGMAIKHNRKLLEAYYNFGLTQIELKKYFEALQSFSFLQNFYPYDAELKMQIANVLMKMKYHKVALMFYDECINLDKNSFTLYSRGLAYKEIFKFKKAKKDLNRAILEDKNNVAAHFHLGITHLYSREFEKAIFSFNNALSYNAIDHEALVGLAIAYYHLNDDKNAKKYFNKARSILTPELDYKKNISYFRDTYWYDNEKYLFKIYYDKLDVL